MKRARGVLLRLLAAAIVVVAFSSVQAHAASKEIVELQTQVQQLLDMVQRLQSTVDARFGAMQHLVEQAADNTNQMSQAVTAMQQKINAQADATSGKLDTTSGQIQSMNDSVDELKTRIARLDKSIQEMQSQLQNIQNPPSGASPQNPGVAADGGQPGGQVGTPVAPAANQAPPLKETYQAALRDFNAAKYDVAAGEFQDMIRYYPDDDFAGTAEFYLGEIAYRQKGYVDAVKDYTAVLEQYPGSSKAPAAQLHKGLALLQVNKKDAGVHELRSLIQRHPQTPEADQARHKLNELGVRISTAR